MSQDYYELLGISRDATADDIRKAYRKLARKLHPDVNPDPETQEHFKEVTRAYEVLSDPKKREVYDLGGDPLSTSGTGGGFGAGFNFTDIMDAFFGATGAGGGRGPRSRVRRGQDALLRLQVDLEDAVFGGVEEVQVDTAVVCPSCNGGGAAPGTQPTTCPSCQGRGEVSSVQRSFLGQVMTTRPCPQCQGYGTIIPSPCSECVGEGRVRARRNLSVRIPAGVDDGTRIQLSGQSEVGPGGGPAGDLYIEIEVRAHDIWHRRGADLHCSITVPMTAAALGTTVPIKTLDNKDLEIEVKPGTQSGAEVVIPEQGVPHLSRPTRGNIVAHIVVETPTKLDGAQRELLEQLAKLRGEDAAKGKVTSAGKGGLFSRLKDAFNER
ncbi:MAG TPA: molecular chaperone DnaJ [Actinopolymorphaceae bacterium]